MPDQYELARHGDPDALRAVTEAVRPRLARMATFYARRTGLDADDLLQDAWCGLFAALPQMDVTVGSPRQYLISRARWRMLDGVRRERLRRCLPLDHGPETDAVAHEEDTMDALAIGEFMSGLKPNQRALARLLLDGFTWREAGTHMGCTSANVAYHVRRIRAAFEQWQADACL